MHYLWNEEPVFCFTSDIDWASESIIEYSNNLLKLDKKKITYFNTHESNYLNSLKNKDSIDLLIHPNFLPKSSHGHSYEEVITNCLKFAPDSIGFRSHRYFEVNDIFDIFLKLKFKFFSNMCTNCEINLKPIHHRSGLLSIPIFFEDGGYLLMDPEMLFNSISKKLDSPGLKVLNIHPAHMAFNTPNFNFTRSIKDSLSRAQWNNISKSQIKRIENKKFGIRNFVEKIIEYIEKKGHRVMSITQIFNMWSNNLK